MSESSIASCVLFPRLYLQDLNCDFLRGGEKVRQEEKEKIVVCGQQIVPVINFGLYTNLYYYYYYCYYHYYHHHHHHHYYYYDHYCIMMCRVEKTEREW